MRPDINEARKGGYTVAAGLHPGVEYLPLVIVKHMTDPWPTPGVCSALEMTRDCFVAHGMLLDGMVFGQRSLTQGQGQSIPAVPRTNHEAKALSLGIRAGPTCHQTLKSESETTVTQRRDSVCKETRRLNLPLPLLHKHSETSLSRYTCKRDGEHNLSYETYALASKMRHVVRTKQGATEFTLVSV